MQIQSKWKETIRKAQDVKELFSAFKEAISKKNTFPYAEVEAAYRHSISNHGGMARLEKEWLDNALKSLSETLDTEGEERYRSQIPQIISAFERKYLQKRKSVWDVRSGVYSGFIAGRSKLNSKQINSRNSGLDRAEEAFNSWMKAEIQAIYDEYGVTATRRKAEQAKNAKKQAIREWEGELKKKLKAEEKKLPIINRDGEGYKRMTSAEWGKTHSDYKGIMVSGDGKYRYRVYMTTPVFITDKPVKIVPEKMVIESVLDLEEMYPLGMVFERSGRDDIQDILTGIKKADDIKDIEIIFAKVKHLDAHVRLPKAAWQMSIADIKDYHRKAVKQAIEDGYDISEDILREFQGEPWADTILFKESGGTNKAMGRKDTVYMPDNSEVEIQYAVMELDQVKISHTDDFGVNPDFPQELQPRDRGRDATRLHVEKMANELNPERLGISSSVTSGAPIIGKDNVCESGNGRAIAIRKAYKSKRGKGQEYKSWLIDNADKMGLSETAIRGMEQPVLVRIRLTDLDRQEFTRKANQDEIAKMSPAEVARSDASRITNDDLDVFFPSEDGSVTGGDNKAFVSRFLAKLGANEAAGMVTADGKPTKQLSDRIKAAIFQKAYADDALLELMSEEENPGVKNVITALTVAAGSFAKAKAMNGGHLGKLDIPSHAIGAAKLIRKAKANGVSLEDELAQMPLFSKDGIPPETAMIAKMIDGNIRSAKRISKVFKISAEKLVEQIADKNQMSMFGDKPELSPSEIIDIAIKKAENDEKQQSLF
jgi:hypothetical protein